MTFNLHRDISSLVKPERGKVEFRSVQNRFIKLNGTVNNNKNTITTFTNLSITKNQSHAR